MNGCSSSLSGLCVLVAAVLPDTAARMSHDPLFSNNFSETIFYRGCFAILQSKAMSLHHHARPIHASGMPSFSGPMPEPFLYLFKHVRAGTGRALVKSGFVVYASSRAFPWPSAVRRICLCLWFPLVCWLSCPWSHMSRTPSSGTASHVRKA